MNDQEMYNGFITKEKQEEYKEYLINRLGEKVKDTIDVSEKKMKDWSKADWDKFMKEWDVICKDLAKLLAKNLKVDSVEVQNVIRRHFKWLPFTGNACSKATYIGLGQGYTEFEWKKTFEPDDPNHPRLAKFMAEAMKVFADRELLE